MHNGFDNQITVYCITNQKTTNYLWFIKTQLADILISVRFTLHSIFFTQKITVSLYYSNASLKKTYNIFQKRHLVPN